MIRVLRRVIDLSWHKALCRVCDSRRPMGQKLSQEEKQKLYDRLLERGAQSQQARVNRLEKQRVAHSEQEIIIASAQPQNSRHLRVWLKAWRSELHHAQHKKPASQPIGNLKQLIP